MTFKHLQGVFIQSDYIAFTFYQSMHSMGIKPLSFAMFCVVKIVMLELKLLHIALLAFHIH